MCFTISGMEVCSRVLRLMIRRLLMLMLLLLPLPPLLQRHLPSSDVPLPPPSTYDACAKACMRLSPLVNHRLQLRSCGIC